MPQRSEPQILADLIRLLTRIESEAERLRREGRPHGQLESDCELIEQARAALHRHVVAEGKAYLNRPRAPLNLWTGACFAAGAVAVAPPLFGHSALDANHRLGADHHRLFPHHRPQAPLGANMTPQELEQIERSYDKARSTGAHALADWAEANGRLLFATLRPQIDGSKADHLAPLRPLYPESSDSGIPLADLAASEIVLRRGAARSDDPANDAPAFNYGDPRRITDALRPFAALGAPVCLTALEEYRILNDLPDALPVFSVPDMSTGEGALAFVTAEQLKAAHDLINEIDGGEGA